MTAPVRNTEKLPDYKTPKFLPYPRLTIQWTRKSIPHAIYKFLATDTLAVLDQTCLNFIPYHIHVYLYIGILQKKDYGVLQLLVVLGQSFVWLERPIWEWQFLPHSEQMWSVASLSPWFRAFTLICLFVSACSASVFWNLERPKAALPASKPNVLKPLFPIHWCQNAQGLHVPLADIFIVQLGPNSL